MSRSIVHVLLSVLLLLAQQATTLHVATDWGGAQLATKAQAAPAAGTSDPANPAPHGGCALCMDSAQLAFALPLPVSGFLPLTLSFDAPPGPGGTGVRLPERWNVQPRAPPQA